MMKFLSLAVMVKSVSGACTAEQGVTVISSTYPEANGCYGYDGLFEGYPSFSGGNGAIIPYTYDIGGSGVTITRWIWIYSTPLQACDLDVVDGALSAIENPANGGDLTGGSATTGSCSNVEVEFSCGCSETDNTETIEEDPEELDSECVYLNGADSAIGYAGGIPDFPSLDGCYTDSASETFSISGVSVVYSRFEEDQDGPLLMRYGEYWILSQYDFDEHDTFDTFSGYEYDGDIISIPVGVQGIGFGGNDDPTSIVSWIGAEVTWVKNGPTWTNGEVLSGITVTNQPVDSTPVEPTPSPTLAWTKKEPTPTPTLAWIKKEPTPTPTLSSPTRGSVSNSSGSGSGSLRSSSVKTGVIVGSTLGLFGVLYVTIKIIIKRKKKKNSSKSDSSVEIEVDGSDIDIEDQ